MVFKKSNAQGTIEYLVILAVVIVIALVVVGMLISINDSNSIVSKNNELKNRIGKSGISITETVLDFDGDAAISIKKLNIESGVIDSITVGDRVVDYTVSSSFGDNLSFYLNNLDQICTCVEGETQKICEFYLNITKPGIGRQSLKFEVPFECVDNIIINDGVYSENFFLSGGGISSEVITEITIDSSDNIYVAGYFRDAISLGHLQVTSNGELDIFVAKINGSNDEWEWVVNAGGTGDDQAEGLVVDENGDILVIGNISNSASFGSNDISGASSEAFFAKLSPNGVWQSAFAVGQGSLFDIITDGDKAYVSGALADFEFIVGEINELSGTFDWNAHGTGVTNNGITDIVLLNDSNIGVAGEYQDFMGGPSEVTFGNFSFDLEQNGVHNSLFVGKVSLSGEWLWVNNVKADAWDFTSDLITDSDGNMYITGMISEENQFGDLTVLGPDFPVFGVSFIAKIDRDTNAWFWVTTPSFDSNINHYSWGQDLFFNSNNVYVVGSFSGMPTSFGDFDINSTSGDDSFFAKLNKDTNEWVAVNSTNAKSINGVIVDSKNRPIIYGSFTQDINYFNGIISSEGSDDFFVWRTDFPN
jgi:hypothetical protein